MIVPGKWSYGLYRSEFSSAHDLALEKQCIKGLLILME